SQRHFTGDCVGVGPWLYTDCTIFPSLGEGGDKFVQLLLQPQQPH
ncbi:hypothetical protein EVAR_101685_1, partial [Eumeta japonica]